MSFDCDIIIFVRSSEIVVINERLNIRVVGNIENYVVGYFGKVVIGNSCNSIIG